jgi:Domain of unknown function (DUF6458)
VGIGVGLLLIAVGAILAFAVNADIQGLDVHVVGWILMIVGLVGILLDLMLWQSWRRGFRRTAYVEGEPAPRAYRRPARRTVVEEEEVGPPPPGPPPPPP